MRAEKLTDLIYSVDGKGPGTAEVTIHFDNKDRELPIDQDEVTVTRRIKSSDSGYYSYYYFNDKPCSLTDIHEQLAKAKISPDGYNVVMQGDVTRIISVSDGERRTTADRLPGTAGVLPEAASGIPLDEVIGPDQLPPYLAYLAAIPGIRVWQTGRSHGGRALWAMSLSAPAAGRIAPPQKLSAWRPTLLIQARHHANEVSSTNSILAFAEEAARTGLASRVNLFFSPMANADGAAIHYAMQQAHPNWKLHAARFNAAGVDFGISDLYQREPRFGEARVLPTLWRAVQPDVILDDHGYPSHEWVQPFAGYNSPPYFGISWWMPNALIYGIHYCLDPERFPANHAVQEALRSALVKRFAADPEIAGYTRTLLDRYYNYGQRHVPEKFPLELQEGMVARTAKVNAGPEARKFSGRFPHITAAELVTEVPDETAQGDYLALCARAHLEGDRAVYETLARKPQPVVRRRWTEGGLTWWAVGRERPVSVLDLGKTKGQGN
jgi:hypothetical protein